MEECQGKNSQKPVQNSTNGCTKRYRHKRRSSSRARRMHNEELGMLECLASDECWDILCNAINAYVTPDKYLSIVLFRSLFFSIINIKEQLVFERMLSIIEQQIKWHPPNRAESKDYYYQLLAGNLCNHVINIKYLQYTFTKIIVDIKELLMILNSQSCDKKLQIEKSVVFAAPKEFSTQNLCNWLEHFSSIELKWEPDTEIPEDFVLRLDRLFTTFRIINDILEEDLKLSIWEYKGSCKKMLETAQMPIIRRIAWSEYEQPGVINSHCTSIFELLPKCPKVYWRNVFKYITLMAQVLALEKSSSDKPLLYNDACQNFAKELAAAIKDCGLNNISEMIPYVDPDWLRLLLVKEFLMPCDTSLYLNLKSILSFLQEKLMEEISCVKIRKPKKKKLDASPTIEKNSSKNMNAKDTGKINDDIMKKLSNKSHIPIFTDDTQFKLLYQLLISYLNYYNLENDYDVCDNLLNNFSSVNTEECAHYKNISSDDQMSFLQLYELLEYLASRFPENSNLKIIFLSLKFRKLKSQGRNLREK